MRGKLVKPTQIRLSQSHRHNACYTPLNLPLVVSAGLFSIVENKSFTLTPIRTSSVIGSNQGSIIAAAELHLLNPVPGDQIALPSITTIEQVKPTLDDAGALHKYQCTHVKLQDYLFENALSSDPSTGDNYVVLSRVTSFVRGTITCTFLKLHAMICCNFGGQGTGA